MRKPRVHLLLLGVALALGCAPRTLTLKPGDAVWSEQRAQADGERAWSVWVAEVVDLRGAVAEPAQVGVFHPRFHTESQTVYLDPPPTQYLREQLSRFLFYRGLEASEGRRARVLLHLDLTEFSLVEVPGSVVDEISLQVAYKVRFVDPSGKELGHLRLKGGRVIKTPVGAPAQARDGFRDALADTFEPLVQSEVFRKIMANAQ